MKTVHIFRLAALSLVGGALAVSAACSSNNPTNETGPTVRDSGTDTTASSSGGGSSGTTSSGDSSADSGTSSSSGSSDAGDAGSDTSTSACTPDATPNCNSCATVDSDPYNTCSAYTVNCLPYTGTVPSHPQL